MDHTAIRLPRQQGSAREVVGGAIRDGLPGGPAGSLYVHVPFCEHKCHYCDFYSIVDARDRRAEFVDRLGGELAALSPGAGGAPLATIFVGGGTPSLLGAALWKRVLADLDRWFDLSAIRRGSGPGTGEGVGAAGLIAAPGTEFTVECNPESVSAELFDVLRAGGVDRVSLGAQSFDRGHLRTLQRRHDPEKVGGAVEGARRAGFTRVSVDLICAVPGQTLEQWEADLREAVTLGVEHVSAYNLTYEPGTAMTARLRRGEFEPVREDREIEMFHAAGSVLGRAGLVRYETSNYARPGSASRHNLAYWRQEPWVAAGPSASGHLGGRRWKNAPRLDDYLEFDDGGFAPIAEHEGPDARRALRERIMTGLRLSEGIDGSAVRAEAARLGPVGALDVALGRQVARGVVSVEGGRWRVTSEGELLADGLAGELMRALM